MSVIVKGMEMPKACHAGCPLTDRDAFTCVVTGKDIVWGDEDTLTRCPSFCPLVEIPTPHGRLIDADHIVQYQLFDPEHEEWYMHESTVDEMLRFCEDDVPTVMEGECV